MLLLLHSAFMLSVVKMLLKGDVGGCDLNSHGIYIVDHGKSWNCAFEFLWEPLMMNRLPGEKDGGQTNGWGHNVS